jgi:hypothetical protein
MKTWKRKALMIYFSLLIAAAIAIILFTWNPIAIIPNMEETTITKGPGGNMTIISTIENQTTKLTENITTIIFNNSGITKNTTITTAEPIIDEVFQTNLESLFDSREGKLVLIATLFGVMGASVQGISSLVVWNSRGKLEEGWGLWYLARPLVGAALAVITYLIIRVGLIPSPSGALVINDFGVAAIGALVGLMADEMSQKLRDIFDSLFGLKKPPEEKGEEPDKWIRNMLKFPDGEEIEIKVNAVKELRALVQKGDGSPIVKTKVHFVIKDTSVLEFVETPQKTVADIETNTAGEAAITVKGTLVKNTVIEASTTPEGGMEIKGQVSVKVVQ